MTGPKASDPEQKLKKTHIFPLFSHAIAPFSTPTQSNTKDTRRTSHQ